ncbi:hypothetical protein Dimus_008096, partial [Dionaea muscipula]
SWLQQGDRLRQGDLASEDSTPFIMPDFREELTGSRMAMQPKVGRILKRLRLSDRSVSRDRLRGSRPVTDRPLSLLAADSVRRA